MISLRFVKFIAVGGVAAIANFGSRILLGLWLDYVTSIVVAYCIGMVTAFFLNRIFVFDESTNALHHQAMWFTVVNLVAVLQTVLVSLLFTRYVFPAVGMRWHAETVAHAIGVLVPVFTSYLGHKHLSFRGTI